jgi:hypothetical protein
MKYYNYNIIEFDSITGYSKIFIVPKTELALNFFEGEIEINLEKAILKTIKGRISNISYDDIVNINQSIEIKDGFHVPEYHEYEIKIVQKSLGEVYPNFFTVYDFNHYTNEKLIKTKERAVLWQEFNRLDPLNKIDSLFYLPIENDSAKKNTLTRFSKGYGKVLKFISYPIVRIGIIDYQPLKSIRINQTEGLRPTIYATTNEKLTDNLKLFSEIGYGLRDNKLKYDFALRTSFFNDKIRLTPFIRYGIREFARAENEIVTEFENQVPEYRVLLIDTLNYQRNYGVVLNFRLNPKIIITSAIQNFNEISNFKEVRDFNAAELVYKFQYYSKPNYRGNKAFKRLVSNEGLSFSVEYLHPLITNQMYNRIFSQIEYNSPKTILGKSFYQLNLGYNSNNEVSNRNFNLRGGGGRDNNFVINNTFHFIKANQYFSNAYSALFFRHYFTNATINKISYKPIPFIIHNAAYTPTFVNNRIENSENSLNEIYTEAGFGFADVLNNGSISISFRYRYGAYNTGKFRDNFIFSLGSEYVF